MISTISISNTIKMMPRRKNRRENGIRAVFLGSNPHSNGEVFSRSLWDRLLSNHAAANVRAVRSQAKINAEVINVTDREH
jgi:hypothetical protein